MLRARLPETIPEGQRVDGAGAVQHDGAPMPGTHLGGPRPELVSRLQTAPEIALGAVREGSPRGPGAVFQHLRNRGAAAVHQLAC